MSVEFPTLNKCNTIRYRASSGCKSYAPGNDAERTWSMDHGPWNKVAARVEPGIRVTLTLRGSKIA